MLVSQDETSRLYRELAIMLFYYQVQVSAQNVS